MGRDLEFDDLTSAAQKLRLGAVSPVDLLNVCLERMRHQEAVLHCFIHQDRDAALQRARRAEREIAAGRWRGPLHGVPFALKDVFDTRDMPTTGHSALYRHRQPLADARCVAALRRAGAVMLGKLAAWECAVGGYAPRLPWPPARNPWDASRDPGGSSSGSAAAIAAGFCLGATGSDTGGSIREPAAWCGIAGLKPTFGLVDTSGVMAASHSLDHAGPMAWSSADCGLVLDGMRGVKPRVPLSDDVAVSQLNGLRIGVVNLDAEADLQLEAGQHASLLQAAAAFGAAGAQVVQVRIAPLAVYSAVCTLLASTEGYVLHQQALDDFPDGYDALTRKRLLAGRHVQASDYVLAQRERAHLVADAQALMADVDLLLMPVCTTTAPPLGQTDSHAGHPSLTRPWNVTGFPALSVCSGFSAQGLPFAVQLIGRPFEDARVLQAGQGLERLLASRARRPLPATSSELPLASPALGAQALEETIDTCAALLRSRRQGHTLPPASRFELKAAR